MSKSNLASYSKPEELATNFQTDLINGLQQYECDSRFSLHGYNEFKPQESGGKIILYKYLEQFKNPLLQLLLLSAIISICMGQYDDAISITLAVLIVITVAFIQEYRSEKSLQELNKLVPPTCRVIRDGREQEFLAKYLVPGDIVLLTTGDRVPADLRLYECHDLGIDESNLTGETELSMKSCITKRPAFRYNATTTIGDKNHNDNNNNNNSNNNNNNNNNVINDNNNDFYADELNANLKKKNHNGEINSTTNTQTNFNPFKNGPNAKTKASDNNHLVSTENLAFMGTLVQSGNGKGIVIGTGEDTQFGTVFKMMQSEECPKSPLQTNMDELGKQLSIYSLIIICVIVFVGWIQSRPTMEMFSIGVSLAVAAIPEGLPIVVTVTLALGVMRMAKKKAVVKQLSAVETLGCVRVICSDKTGTLTKNEMTVTRIITAESYKASITGVGYEDQGELILDDLSQGQSKQMQSIKNLFNAACICSNAKFDSCNKLIGQATEGAILFGAKKLGLSNVRSEYTRLEEIPFDSKNKYMAVKCIFNGSNGSPVYYVKGAIEVILQKCKWSLYDGGKTVRLSTQSKENIFRSSEYLESLALRVLAIASGSDMDNLTYLGLLGIHDAPRENAKETLEILRNAGIEVKMITGDSKNTAQSIAKLVGIGNSLNLYSMSGQEIEELISDSRLSQLEKAENMSKVSVFYRVTPSHKVTIVKMLQLLGNITAMTGDGVNDSVALKKADIGVAMGSSGTDVCKEAAEVVLMDDNLGTLIVAIEEGKGIFYNIRNFIRFQLSTSVAALSLIALSTFLHIPAPFNAMQILYINILMDGPPAQSLGLEKVSQDVLMQPPRNVKEPVLSRELLLSVFISAGIMFAGTMMVFISEMSDNQVTPRDTTMTFTCFVFYDLFNAMTCRSQTKTVFEIGWFTNRALLLSILGCLLGQFIVIYLPPFQMIFQTEALSFTDIIKLTVISSTVFIVSESIKLFKNRIFKRRLFHKTSMYLV